MIKADHFLSLVVPVYKQEKTIRQDILNIIKTLEKIRYPFEIICVVDGKKIDNSYKILKKIKHPSLFVTGYNHNRGKGFAVRFGIAHTKGDYIAFIDSGMEIDPNGISMIIEHLEWYDADIICASKRHPASIVKYPFSRRIVSFGGQMIAKFLLGIPIKDTQAGLKIFKRKVLEKVLPRLLVKQYAFDLEMLAIANHLGYKRIFEAPIKLGYDFGGLTHAVGRKVVLNCLNDALAVFYRLRILHYYDDKNKRKWVYDKELKLRVNTG